MKKFTVRSWRSASSLGWTSLGSEEVSLYVSVYRPLHTLSLYIYIYIYTRFSKCRKREYVLLQEGIALVYKNATLCSPEHWTAYLDNKATISINMLGILQLRSDKGLLIFDGAFFLFLSCQYVANFVLTHHPDRQKKFRVDRVIPYLGIFQTQRGYRGDW